MMRLMRLILTNGEVDFTKSWIKARDYAPELLSGIMDANLRDMYPSEVVLDVETKMQSDFVRKRLLAEGISFVEYDTGSRGRHFHILFKDMESLTESERLIYREEMIKDYGADLAKKNGWIAMEYRPHFKSGAIKSVVSNHMGVNEMIPKYLNIAKRKGLKRQETRITHGRVKESPLISEILYFWGIDISRNPCDTPFAASARKKCLHYDDRKGLWYDFHNSFGGDIITLFMKKYGVSYDIAIGMIEEYKRKHGSSKPDHK